MNEERTTRQRFAAAADLTIERYLCDDLPEEEKTRVEEAIRSSAELSSYVSLRREEQAAFFAAHPMLPQRAAVPARSIFAGWRGWAAIRTSPSVPPDGGAPRPGSAIPP